MFNSIQWEGLSERTALTKRNDDQLFRQLFNQTTSHGGDAERGFLCYEDVYPKEPAVKCGNFVVSAVNFDFWFRFPLLQSTAFLCLSLSRSNEQVFPFMSEFSHKQQFSQRFSTRSFEVLLNVVKSVPALKSQVCVSLCESNNKKKKKRNLKHEIIPEGHTKKLLHISRNHRRPVGRVGMSHATTRGKWFFCTLGSLLTANKSLFTMKDLHVVRPGHIREGQPGFERYQSFGIVFFFHIHKCCFLILLKFYD